MAAKKKTGANRKPLASMTLKELRRTYRLVYGLDTASTSKPDLRKCIAARRAERTKVRAGRRVMVNAERDPRLPPLGTVLTRVHDGTIHRTTVREAGFEYRRRTYASLSSVAKAITGCNWNGFGFFNLLRKSPGIEGEGES